MSRPVKTLLAGWFSFESMGATAGDLLARDVAMRWLADAGHHVDIAVAPPFSGGVRWDEVDPSQYSHVVFVCGPFGDGPPIQEFLARFEACKLVGLDLSMLDPIEVWNPFDLLIERDSSRAAHPDIALASRPTPVPLVGIALVHPQQEYGDRGLHHLANRKIERVAAEIECARIHIDTRLDVNALGLRTPNEVYALIGKLDVMLTTRLHGLVLGLKAGVPVVAVDPIAGGAKVTQQAAALNWPLCFDAYVPLATLRDALTSCLRPTARADARLTAERAQVALDSMHVDFISRLSQ